MDFGASKTTVEKIEKVHLEEHIHSEPFMSVKISSCLCSYFWGGISEIQFLREQF